MSEADGWFWFITVCFTIVVIYLHSLRARLKRIEKKLDIASKRSDF